MNNLIIEKPHPSDVYIFYCFNINIHISYVINK